MHSSSHQLTFQEEWKEFFGKRVDLERIEKSCLSGRLRGSHVRSIIWRILLRCLPLQREEWCTILLRTRNSYNKLKSQLVTNPREQTSCLDPNVSNPLSLGEENPWQQYFTDCKLRGCINRDVERTFPELEYFKNENIRTIMSDILFIYAKEHPDIGYRQGMHEILATLIFVLNYDQQAFVHLMEQNSLKELPPQELEILLAVNNQDFLEHDSFEIFTQLMMMLERWYLTGDEEYVEHSSSVLGSNSKLVNPVPFVNRDDVADSRNELIIKLQSIMNDILAIVDPAIHRHLSKMKILPQIYGIRWLRLLFGREFPIHDLLFVWDAIFAFRPPLSLVDYIFVAMLQYIRHLIIDEDYSTTLQYLMRYPPVADAHSLIQYALHIKSPKKFELPPCPIVTNFENITVAGMIHPNRSKDMIETKSALEKSKRTNSPGQLLSPKRVVYNTSENKQQQQSDAKSFVAKIVDTLSDRTMAERGLIRPQVNYNIGAHKLTKAPDEITELLQEQVSCLQSRLNDMDMMGAVVKQRISFIIDEQLSKIVGNDDLKKVIEKELHSIQSQVENAARLDVNNHPEVAASTRYRRRSGHGIAVASDVIEVGNEVCPPALRSLSNGTDSSSISRLQASLDTEMREIKPHSVLQ